MTDIDHFRDVLQRNVNPVINTDEARDALPYFTVVMCVDRYNGFTVYQKWQDGWHGLGMIDQPFPLPLPATVLHIPEETP